MQRQKANLFVTCAPMEEHFLGEELYNLSFENRGTYLFADVTGESDSLEISLQFWKLIQQEARRLNLSRILVQENFCNNLSTFDLYILNQNLGQMGFNNTRIAFIDLQEGHHDQNTFGETVAINRGLIMKVFLHSQEAENWLLEY